jgi:hypothetical protein
VSATAEVERLLRPGVVEVCVELTKSPAAQWCLEQYFTELAKRLDMGFDPARSNSASTQEMAPSAGFFVVVWLDGDQWDAEH